jgi:hypothetical protein
MLRAAVYSTFFFFFYHLPQNVDIFAIDIVAWATRLQKYFFSLSLFSSVLERNNKIQSLV